MARIAGFYSNLLNSSLRLFTSVAPQAIASRSCHIMARSNVPLNTNVTSPMIPIASGMQQLLAPFTSLLTQVAGFKVRARLRRRCKDCYFVIRHQRHYVICPTHPRHKQMSMKKRDYKSWILTHATQSKVRPY